MKKVLVITLLLYGFIGIAQQQKEVNSEIREVTVYLQGAHVTHQVKTRLASGETKVIIPGLSNSLDGSSIQVKGTGQFVLKGVNHIRNYLRKSKNDKKIDSLETLIKSTQNEIYLTQARKDVLTEELSLLNANKNLGGNNGTNISALKSALQFYQTEVTRIKKSQITENEKSSELNIKLNALRNQLNVLKQQQRQPSYDIEITLQASRSTDANLEVSYFTRNAGWVPNYDVRVDDINSPVQLAYKAQVYQNTGEDWKNVRLTFSNANPNQGGNVPQMNAWYLNYIEPARKRENYGRVEKTKRMMAPAAARSEPMMEEVVMEEYDMEQLSAAVVESQTSFQFVVPVPYTIKSNSDRITIDLNQYEIPATYEYYAIPKLDKDAFLVARVFDWDQYALLGGQMNLYFEDGFVGRSFLDPESSGDTLDLSLGRDKGIVIERKKIDQYTENKTLAGSKIASRGYSIEVRNKKGQEIELSLFDQVPVSANSEIEIRDVKTGGAIWNQQTGELKWKIKVGSGQNHKIEFRFEVKYPKNAILRID